MLAHTRLIDRLDALRQSAPDGFVRLREPLAVDSLPGWLKAQPLYPRIYWHARERDREFATLGCLREIRDPALLPSLSGHPKPAAGSWPRYYGGLAFDAERAGLADPTAADWRDFGPCRFVLPRIELIRNGAHTELVCNLWFEGDNLEAELAAARAVLQQLRPPATLAPLPHQAYVRSDCPDFARWQAMVAKVTTPASLAEMPKVVLSRQSTLTLTMPLDPWDLLVAWQGMTQACFHFAFQFSPERCFLACSPERLYRRQELALFTEALAGTIVRTGNDATDDRLAEQLLADNKNRLENRLVHADILTRLEDLTEQAELSPPRILRLRRVQHLKRDIRARLKPGVADWQLLAALHPTPAVGGTPRRKAMAFIRSQEPYQRGWYAGACGLISEDVSEFAVAIRCGLWEGQQLRLFTGAGLVEGSEARAEWQELDDKLASLLGPLG